MDLHVPGRVIGASDGAAMKSDESDLSRLSDQLGDHTGLRNVDRVICRAFRRHLEPICFPAPWFGVRVAGFILSSVTIKYQLGFDRQAGSVIGVPGAQGPRHLRVGHERCLLGR